METKIETIFFVAELTIVVVVVIVVQPIEEEKCMKIDAREWDNIVWIGSSNRRRIVQIDSYAYRYPELLS